MTIFVVIALTEVEKVREAVEAEYVAQSRSLGPSSWLVVDDLTATEVSAKLKISDGGLGAQAVVLRVSAYTGFAASGLWDWLGSRWAKKVADE